MYIDIRVNCPLFLSDFNKRWLIQNRFSKNVQINLMKMRPAGAELFHADEQTDRQDMTNLIVVLCNSTNTPKNEFSVKDFLWSWEWEIINYVKRWNNFNKYNIWVLCQFGAQSLQEISRSFHHSRILSLAQFLCSVRCLSVPQTENILLNTN